MKKTTRTSTDTYHRITNLVIELLEKGQVVWQKGWNEFGLPKNIITARSYQGFNAFFLNFATIYYQYRTPYFITYKQAMLAGGTIRRGEKGYPVIWWATVENDNSEENKKVYRVPKCHTVFNIDQTHGIDFPKVETAFRSHAQKINACDAIINKMPHPPEIRHGGDKAFYHRTGDYIMLPAVERFHSDHAYYKTKFHELAHSTGHATRLNRKELVESDGYGNELYSKEELTAELTAAYLCAVAGIEQHTIINSTAYIQGWLKVLKEDKRLILKASAQAQATANYIMNNKEVDNEQPSETITTQ